MKRIAAMLLCLVVILSLSACGSKTPAIIGTWKCDDFNEIASTAMNVAGELSGMGMLGSLGDSVDMDVSLTFKEDGTYQLDMSVSMLIIGTQTETSTGTYSYQNNQLIMDGEPVNAKISGKTLTLEENTPEGLVLKLTFKKQ